MTAWPTVESETHASKMVRLGDILDVQNGFAFSSKNFTRDGEVGLIRIRDLKNGERTQTRFSGEYSSDYLVRAGDLLIGMDGEFRCYQWRGEPALLNQRVCRLINFAEDVVPEYLLFVLNEHLKQIEDVTGYATVKHLSSKTIKEIELPLPPVAEQQRIAANLDAIDDRIRGMTAALAGLRRRQSTLLRSVFASEFTSGENPTVTLSNVCQVKNGATPKTGIASFWDGEVNWITPAEMGSLDTPYVEATRRTLTTEGLASCSATLSPAYSVILSCRAPIGYVVINTVPMATNQGCKTLIPTEDVHYKYLYHFLAANTELLNGLGTGATFPEISARALKQVEIPLPPVAEQVRIAKKLDDFTEATQRLDASIAKQMSAARQLQVAALHSFLEGGK